MAGKTQEINNAQKEIINNVRGFVKENRAQLSEHYLSVKTEDGRNKDADIYVTIDLEAYHAALMGVSVVILTANYNEREILNRNVYKQTDQKIQQLQDGLHIFHDRYIIKAYIMKIGEYNVLHLHAPETGSNTPCGSTDLVRYIESCAYIAPKCIISFGICYGIDYKTYNLGDTIIASRIYPWSVGVKINDDGWKIKCDEYILDLENDNGVLYNKIRDCAGRMKLERPKRKVEVGNMLSGEAVISSERVKLQAIQNSYSCNILGGEMEGYGLAKECHYYCGIPCVIIKAICDWGAVKNIDQYISKKLTEPQGHLKDQIQAYTAYCAFVCLYDLFVSGVFSRDSIESLVFKEINAKYSPDGFINSSIMDTAIKDAAVKRYERILNFSEKKQQEILDAIKTVIIKKYFQIAHDGEKEVGYWFNSYFF